MIYNIISFHVFIRVYRFVRLPTRFLLCCPFLAGASGRARSHVIVISSSHVALRDFVGHGYLRSVAAEELVERSE